MLLSFFFDYLFKDLYILAFFDKNDILMLLNLLNLFYYNIYKLIKNISLLLYFNFMQLYLILIYNNTYNKFLNTIFYFFFILKKNVLYFS